MIKEKGRAGLGGSGEDFAFYPQPGRNPDGFWAEEGMARLKRLQQVPSAADRVDW